MRTWEEYKNYVKAVNEEERQQVEEIEAAAGISVETTSID